MAKRPPAAKKSVSAANLETLGAERLSGLLMDAASLDPALKRRLRMELAAEVGAGDLAFEIDKRLTAIATSRARVSWRKRPALLTELRSLLKVITERLAALDARLALDRMVAWFDLYPALTARVSDAKGELPTMFDAATSDLAAVAALAGPKAAAPVLVEALSTRLGSWASWIGRGAPAMEPELARALLAGVAQKVRPTGRLALVVRKLADRAGDLDAWLHAISEEDARKPEFGAEIALRLALVGRAAEARAALEAAKAPEPKTRWGRVGPTEAPSDGWTAAEIAVLEAEGRGPEADEARWSRFARTLSPEDLKTLIARLPDFEDVVALDRAFELATAHPDATRGLVFLMNWPALREAAELITARASEIRGGHDDIPLWAGRLAGRYPHAAILLLRSRARALVILGAGEDDETRAVIAEAEALSSTLEGGGEDHAAFLDQLRAAGRRKPF